MTNTSLRKVSYHETVANLDIRYNPKLPPVTDEFIDAVVKLLITERKAHAQSEVESVLDSLKVDDPHFYQISGEDLNEQIEQAKKEYKEN